MDILGIGPLELFFILIIALVILGPQDMAKAGRSIGRLLRKIVTSQEWRTVNQASREFRTLPNRLMREAGIEDLKKEIPDINKIGKDLENTVKRDINQWQNDLSSWTSPPSSQHKETPPPEDRSES
jgi:Sec-independent protein translocase protein TatA